ncbi:TPA: alpha/beta hydrolase [Bacillus paranthracis]|uniref:alpha/beta hydrolase n=1 Tax=Bacillus cereus group TaxID=86661 RepID=UPI0028BDC447|nr:MULTISPECIES: alpha/beta hydrolase [Bacillus cereus group]
MWTTNIIKTPRGKFEYFLKGEGPPLCVTHLYSEYNDNGNTFANPFTDHYSVYLVNLKGCGNSDLAKTDSEYSMTETIKDLEAIREALYINKWGFAGHSTGGMLALVYATEAQESLTKIIVGGAAASKEYASHKDSIYCSENVKFNRIVSIMNALNDDSTVQEERKALSREWALMSFYSEEKLEEALKLPNSGKTVGNRLNYFRQVEYKDYDVRLVREYFDGDGYVKYETYTVSFVGGSYSFMNSLNQVLQNHNLPAELLNQNKHFKKDYERIHSL